MPDAGSTQSQDISVNVSTVLLRGCRQVIENEIERKNRQSVVGYVMKDGNALPIRNTILTTDNEQLLLTEINTHLTPYNRRIEPI